MNGHIVFIHGYSVSNLNTYGRMPERLVNEAAARGLSITVSNIYLGAYVSFNDDITLDDLARAFEAAWRQELLAKGISTFSCITHSTGGPLLRNWLQLFYDHDPAAAPLRKLIMLAPANHGSALAQLGKSRLSRIRAWIDGVEPGEKILDWLELGSSASCELNKKWIRTGSQFAERGVFFFVITGQDIDRKLYDHLNSYTGEPGSDGVVRVASANLNNQLVQLVQNKAGGLDLKGLHQSPVVPFRIVARCAHSNGEMGIMRSVKPAPGDAAGKETIGAVFDCLAVSDKESYLKLAEKFNNETSAVQTGSRLEMEQKLTRTRFYIHDRHAMFVFRILDENGTQLDNFDLLLTADNNDPDLLPAGFFADRQCNSNHCTLSYYLNYDVLTGTPAVTGPGGQLIRPAITGTRSLGLIVRARPDSGPVAFREARLEASAQFMAAVLKPNSTSLIEITLLRDLSPDLFRIENLQQADRENSFHYRGR